MDGHEEINMFTSFYIIIHYENVHLTSEISCSKPVIFPKELTIEHHKRLLLQKQTTPHRCSFIV